MSRAAGTATAAPTHVIWAETAAPFYVDRDPALRAALAEAAPLGGVLITGAPRATQMPGRPLALWNSLHVIDATGAILATYDKSHQVPFGEYIPLRAWLPGWIAKVAYGEVEFSPGPGVTPLPVPGCRRRRRRFAEAIFEGRVVPGRPRQAGSISPTTPGTECRRGLSALRRRRMRAVEKACRWCASPTTTFRRSSTWAACALISGSVAKA